MNNPILPKYNAYTRLINMQKNHEKWLQYIRRKTVRINLGKNKRYTTRKIP